MPLLRSRPLLLIAPLAVVVAVVAWLLLREEDPYDPVREIEAVESVDDRLSGRGKVVAFAPDAVAADVEEAIDALPGESRGALLRRGNASLELPRDRRSSAGDAAPALIAAGKLRARIEIDARSGEAEAWVRQTSHAVPLARAMVAAGIGPEHGVHRLEVKVERPNRRYGGAPIAFELGSADDLVPAALDAAEDLAERGVTVGTHNGRLDVRVRADDSDGAADAFTAASDALRGVPEALRGDVAIYVDVPDRGEKLWSTAPKLGGAPGSTPGRAAALLRRLEDDGAVAYVETDLEYARMALESRRGTLAAAQAARAAGVERVEVQWELPIEVDWLGPVAGARRGEGTVEAATDDAIRILRGIERARAAGIDGVRFTDDVTRDAPPSLDVSRPGWIRGTGPLAEEDPQALRRLFRTVRTIGWPRSAALRLSLGPDACGKDSNRYASMIFEATRTGRAWKVRGGGSTCDVEEQIATVRRAWDATAR